MEHQKLCIGKKGIGKILKCNKHIKNVDTKNPEIKIDYQKMRYQENPQIQEDFQRKCYKINPEIKIEYQKERYQQNAEIDKKNIKIRDIKKTRKIVTRLTVSCNK